MQRIVCGVYVGDFIGNLFSFGVECGKVFFGVNGVVGVVFGFGRCEVQDVRMFGLQF